LLKGEIKFNIGKNGITSGVIKSLELAFKTRKKIRISILKSGNRDKEKVKEMALELSDRLEGNYKYLIIGFTIIIKKTGSGMKKSGK